MENESCGTCRYWMGWNHKCARYPPQYVGMEEDEQHFDWPKMGACEWCGEYQRKEESDESQS